MAYELGGYKNKKGGRWKSVFIVIVLVHIAAIAAYLIFSKKDQASEPEIAIPAAQPAPAGPVSNGPSPAGPAGLPSIASPSLATPESRSIISDAQAAYQGGQLDHAKKLLDSLVQTTPDPDAIQMLGKINMEMLKSPRPMEGKVYYSIVSGDSLSKIASKFNTTVELTKEINGMTSNMIRANTRIMVYNGDLSVRVSKAGNTLDVMAGNKLLKRYDVGTGKFGKTPAIEFKIVDKIKEPAWTRLSDGKLIEYGDPENVLGTRWMKITSADHPEITGFGIHGTWERDSIGKQSSAGCVRMLNEDVEELFDLLPRKTTVIISD